MPIKRTSFDFLPLPPVGRWMKVNANDSSSWYEKDTSTDFQVAILLCCCPTLDLYALGEKEKGYHQFERSIFNRSHHLSSSRCCCYSRNRINRHLSQHSLSLWVISFVKIENLIRRLNCSCSWIYTLFPYGTPIIIIIYKRSEWVSCVTECLSSGCAWVTNMYHDAVKAFSMRVIWFDWGLDVRVNRNKLSSSHHRRDRQTDRQTGTDLKMKKRNWCGTCFHFVWKTRRKYFSSLTLSGKI